MPDKKTLNDFIHETNLAYEQFCIWMYLNNGFAKHRKELLLSWNKNCKYKNFWNVVLFSLLCRWILSLARLFDPAYHPCDKKKKHPRLSLYYILELLDDASLAKSIQDKFQKDIKTLGSIKKQRDNFIVHNDVNFKGKKLKAGAENLFESLDNAISEIKQNKKHLVDCNDVNLKHAEDSSRCGVDEVFKTLLRG